MDWETQPLPQFMSAKACGPERLLKDWVWVRVLVIDSSCMVVYFVGTTEVGLPLESMHKEAKAADRVKSRMV